MDSIINQVTNDPLLIGVLALIVVFLVYSIFKKLFKLFAFVLVCVVVYIVYLTQIEGISYEEASDRTKSVGKEILEEGKKQINNYKEDIKNQMESKWKTISFQ